MPVIDKTPDALRPYRFHGADLDHRDGHDEAVGTCPWCDREDKWYVSAVTGEWSCKVCAEGTRKGGGNLYTFLRLLWDRSYAQTRPEDYRPLAADRKLLHPDTLVAWGVCKSAMDGAWLLPGYNAKGALVQLYRYARDRISGRMKLWPTPTIGHGLHGVNLFDGGRGAVYVCEGPWDGMALWEALRGTKVIDGEYLPTASEGGSLLADANVVAVPGCTTFNEGWKELFGGKRVALMYDNDHPRPHPKQPGVTVPPAGYEGMRRVSGLLAAHPEPPTELRYLHWGEEGYNPQLPTGYDVRDRLANAGGTPGDRVTAVKGVLDDLQPIPAEWVPGRTDEANEHGGTKLKCLPCPDWRTLQTSWRKAFKWTPGLDRALSVMLAAACSVRVVGDQLWVKVISPPSTGKSVLAEALSVSEQYVKAQSTFKGFYSGYQVDADGTENMSLVDRIRDKAFVVKDGDTILTLPNREQVLGQGRDLYDTVGRSSYNNKMSKDWMGIRFAWILCGTKSLRSLDQSELGERFLDVRIMDDIDDDLEDEIGWRKINQVRANRFEVNGRPDQTDTAELIRAKQLTGGYLEYLRGNMGRLIEAVDMDDSAARLCLHYGTFIAYMRGRPSKKQDEEAGREMSTRLISQVGKLALCLAVVLNRKAVDEEVMARVHSVALDTCQGRVLRLTKLIYRCGAKGVEQGTLGNWTGWTDAKLKELLDYLADIRVVERFRLEVSPGVKGRNRYRLTRRVRQLYEEVVGNGT